MPRAAVLWLLLVHAVAAGCAARAAAPPAPTAAAARVEVRRVAIVGAGESRFTVTENSAEPGKSFEELLSWSPMWAAFRPLAELVHRGINWALELDHGTDTGRHLEGIAPRAVVAQALARTLVDSGRFDEVTVAEVEPGGDARRRLDAIVRLSVPSWGIVRVRAGEPELVSGFADVRATMTVRATGTVLWDSAEDVTGAERVAIETFTRDRGFARQALTDVLERGGQRLGSELLYARGTP
jgi:hypothetical protein